MKLLLLILTAVACIAQTAPAPMPDVPVSNVQELTGRLAQIRDTDNLKVDAEVYLKAVRWLEKFPDELYKPEYQQQMLAVLERGLSRARELENGSASWPKQKGRLARAYRSRVDGSVQPYGLIIPESYDGTKPVRLDVVLHGRAAQMTEISFLFSHDSPKPAPSAQQHIVLEVFGRTNNAYRWAGETDVFEAIESVRSRYNIDPDRVVLRGFSMGGAGAWHIGLHHPDRWVAVEAGAGFVETREYAKLPATTPEYQLRSLSIYDALAYAENAANVPMVGYGGQIDPQLKASESIRKALEGRPASRTLFLVGPETAHKWHPDSLKRSDEFIDAAAREGRRIPEQIHFVTYTTRYNRCFWLTVDGLDRHYDRAEVDGTRERLTTRNISALTLDRVGEPAIDGQKPGKGRSFVKDSGKWKIATFKGLRKRHGLQGPIDDAFQDSFTTIGAPEKVRLEWAKWMRGDLPMASEPEKGKHLILFGDPQTNDVIRKVNDKLPVRWSGDDIVAGGQRFSAKEHTLVMIYPNPLDSDRYLVLNSGLTFGDKEFQGTNALLFPRLGDYAIIRKFDGGVALAGFFDEQWRLPQGKR